MTEDGSPGTNVPSFSGFSAKYKREAYAHVNMVAAYGLQSVRDVLLVSYFDDFINDVEFTVLYEENYSRGLFPYWKYDKFDVHDWDEAECKVELRFDKSDLAVLLHALRFPIDLFVLRGLFVPEWKVFAFC